MIVALAQADITMWWIAIGMSFVVVLVVIVLLSLLVSFVTDIDRNVKSLWGMATRVARNTATTWMLQQTASAAAALADETARHAEALSSVAASSEPAPAAGGRWSGLGGTGAPIGAQPRPGRRY
jgi:hypothetical protein